jgi:hypothetical protein
MAEKRVNQEGRYLSYLLRLWQESAGDLPGGEPPLWRASLEKAQSDMRQGFASLADLFAFLEKETGSRSPDPERSDDEKCLQPSPSE